MEKNNKEVNDLRRMLKQNTSDFSDKFDNFEVSISVTINVTISGVMSQFCGSPHRFIHNLSTQIYVRAYITCSLINRTETNVHLDKTWFDKRGSTKGQRIISSPVQAQFKLL